jgi:UDP-N-acetylglucosamine 4-epimerase
MADTQATTTSLPQALEARVRENSAVWLVTGAAGFIGSHLVETLLKCGQRVVGLDNLSTGHARNLSAVSELVGPENWANFSFHEADIRNRAACDQAVHGVDYVLHQAALGSVPRSVENPLDSHDVNVTGFVNMLDAARRAGVRRFIYAASSSTYGDNATLPKREANIGKPLSPYAMTKLANEIYAETYARSYGFASIGLRYFNVFGPRQDPEGAYAAVIPQWAAAMLKGEEVVINGDGETSRDFCFVANVVQANLCAALASDEAQNEVYNVAVGERTTLNQLYELLRSGLEAYRGATASAPTYADFRVGDVRHSQADISKAAERLGYAPTHGIAQGLQIALPWYVEYIQGAHR